jgi:predicted nuclease of predicted toxin-antitoxin system
MKFLANMGISPQTVEFLREQGHEALHLHEAGLDRWADSEILAKARNESSIVLTSDLDFGDLLAASGDQLPSVILFRLKDMRPENVNAHLRQILEHHGEALSAGVIVSVTERRLRVRHLPIE